MVPYYFAMATRLLRRYLPVVIGLAVITLLAVTVPSSLPSQKLAARDATSGGPAANTAATTPAEAAAAAATNAATQTSVAAAGVAASAANKTASAASAAAAAGKAVSGVTCGTNVRQVSWSTFGPLCTPAWSGDNGGATSSGVTKDTITFSYRLATSGESAALQAAAPSTEQTLDQRSYLADLKTYVNYFNTQFELYGRKVAIKEFTGRGDWIAEYQGQNVEGAQADGAQAHSLGAFADLSMGRTSSTPAYTRALAANKVISFGGATLSQATFDALAPFAYSDESAFDDFGKFFGNVACQRMSGLPAVFAGDQLLKTKTRVFGLINPENPDYSPAGDSVTSKLKGCGDRVAAHVSYSVNLATLQQQSTNAIAQMKTAQVSTVICLCDGISTIFFANSADSQGYHPEWLMMGTSDFTGRRWSSSQVAHSFTAGGIQRATQTEADRVYKLANPTGQPQSVGWTLDLAYESALMTFSALQAAGPTLTPAAVERAFFSLPDSPAVGDYSAWHFASHRYNPPGGLQFGYWDPNAPSPIAGGNGAWVPCTGGDGAYRAWEPADGYGPKQAQLRCFGQ